MPFDDSLSSRLGEWADLPFFSSSLPTIEQALRQEKRTIFPPQREIFASLELTQPKDVRAVVLGQDPYPTAGHAHGLSFSVRPDVFPLPRSLINIFREMQDDIGTCPANGDLRGWARQGVLLLNTALTVPEGEAGGHARLGWDELTRQALTLVSRRDTAFILWGRHARHRARHILPGNHMIIATAHPSPLSAARGFFGSRPFSRINNWLTSRDERTIDWALKARTP